MLGATSAKDVTEVKSVDSIHLKSKFLSFNYLSKTVIGSEDSIKH